MSPKKTLIIRPLHAGDASLTTQFIKSQPSAYSHFFYALAPNEETLAEIFAKADQDVYSGVFYNENLVGIFMLRGWDAGFEIPSFGVLIDEQHKGGTLMRLTLDLAKIICRLAGTKILMAKIHPDNISPRGARRLGFKQVGVEEHSGNIVYHMEL